MRLPELKFCRAQNLLGTTAHFHNVQIFRSLQNGEHLIFIKTDKSHLRGHPWAQRRISRRYLPNFCIKKLTSSTIKRPKIGRFTIRKTFFEHAKSHRFARNFLCYKKTKALKLPWNFLCRKQSSLLYINSPNRFY